MDDADYIGGGADGDDDDDEDDVLYFMWGGLTVLGVRNLGWAVNPQTNSTYRSIKFADNYQYIYQVNDILNRNIILWLSYVSVVTCAVILASKLQAASKFRRSLAGTAIQDKDKISPSSRASGRASTSHNQKSTDKLSKKDLKVIQSVTVICIIFILSQLPYQVMSTVRLFVAEFNNFGSAQAVYGFVSHLSSTCGYLNSSLNIFVHLRFNVRYREQLFALFFRKGSQPD
ncbi:chemosensory receptor A [Elysia marginata]|uniref:Chemosensory receptor A n=1 Tax=Elysia marginata TaxID=1093978 RepID=A0AAV4JWN0_9GAST|nr:chemosensory receptor A [Elysia marginata]